MNGNCQLCARPEFEVIETLNCHSLTELYRESLSIAVNFTGERQIEYRRCLVCDMRYFFPVFTGDEEFYERLQALDWYYSQDKEEFHIARKHIETGDTVLEVGAGDGKFAQTIRCREYVGLELSQTAAEAARQKGINVNYQPLESHAASNKERYDVVCAFQILEHVPNLKAFIENMLSCLRQSGTLIVSVPCEDSFMGRDVNNPLNLPPHHVTRWSDKAVANLGSLYSLDLLSQEHEILSRSHVTTFCNSVVRDCVRLALGSRKLVLDVRFSGPCARKIVRLLSLPLLYPMRVSRQFFRGHSTIAIFRKT